MQPDDLAELQTRIEAALDASAEEFGTDARDDDAPDEYLAGFNATACHLVNDESTRMVLTDPAVRRLGGRKFTVEIDEREGDEEGRIAIRPVETVAKAKARAKARALHPPWSSEQGTGDGGQGPYDPKVKRQIRTTPVGKDAPELQMPDRAEADEGYDKNEANGGEQP